MILTIISVMMILAGLILVRKSNLDFLPTILSAFGSVGLIICICVIIFTHLFSTRTLQVNELEYQGLCKRLEIINSDYEDVSKSEVIRDITNWNMRVQEVKYWNVNSWTNWFISDVVADNMRYISWEE